MKNKRVLITGGAGFVGSNLTLTLQGLYPENRYTVVDNLSSGNQNNLDGFKGSVIIDDIASTDLDKHFAEGVDVIFHQAALTDTTVTDEKKMMDNNVEGLRNVLEFSLRNNARLVYASSAGVYGQSSSLMREGSGESPINVYGESKLIGDNMVREVGRKHGNMTIIGLRYFNIYGPGELHKGKMASMIWKLYLQMKEGRRPRVFKYGEQKRDQVYVKDVVNANLLAMKAPRSGIVNVGSGKPVTFNEIIQALNEAMGTRLEPDYFDNPYTGRYQDFTHADLTQAVQLLDYRPRYDLRAGIQDYLGHLEV